MADDDPIAAARPDLSWGRSHYTGRDPDRALRIGVGDGSLLPTIGGVDPSLANRALACRTADHSRQLAAQGDL